MRVIDIKWDLGGVDFSDLLSSLHKEITYKEIAERFNISSDIFLEMSDDEKIDAIVKEYKCNPDSLYDVLELPTEVEIPNDIEEDDIADYLSDEYEYLVKSFEIEPEREI